MTLGGRSAGIQHVYSPSPPQYRQSKTAPNRSVPLPAVSRSRLPPR